VGDQYWRQFTFDSQVSTYLEGAAALGVKPSACLDDVLGKPALRPAAAAPPDLTEGRHPVLKEETAPSGVILGAL